MSGRIEVLVATMFQTDRSLLSRLNLETDAVVINQCDEDSIEEIEYRGNIIKWVNTTQRGLSRSRNMALSYATGEICILADDDISYTEGYGAKVIEAFERSPQADIIIFNTQMTGTDQSALRKNIESNKKASFFSYYGSVRMTFRGRKVKKHGIHFNDVFGAGATYCLGEDSLFLRECRKNGLSIYENTFLLATVDYSTSTWFRGYNEKYYFDKGAFLCAAYGKAAWFYKWYFVIQSRKISDLSCAQVSKCLSDGIAEFKKR